MATITYAYGYSGGRKTLAQMEKLSAWMLVHPEMRRRLVALMDAARAEGVDLGIGGAGRTSQGQTNLFLSRYNPSDPPCDARWQGVCYRKEEGVAAAAPPGLSFHEQCPPDSAAFAVDMIGDLGWMNRHCDDARKGTQTSKYGLKHFKNVNNEPWHVQPSELPNSRSTYNANPSNYPIKTWALPDGPVPPPLPPVPPRPLNVEFPTLKRGDSGFNVYVMQSIMRHPCGQSTVVADGEFGPKTEAGIRNIQIFFGLTATGICHEATWKAMNLAVAQAPTVNA